MRDEKKIWRMNVVHKIRFAMACCVIVFCMCMLPSDISSAAQNEVTSEMSASSDDQAVLSKKTSSKKKTKTYKNGWNKKKGVLRYYKNNKYYTGLKKIDGKLFYFSKSGKLQTGWQKINGNYYYFQKSGSAGTKGQAATTFGTIDGKKYLFNSSGILQTGLHKVNGQTYYFSASGGAGTRGVALSGWITYQGASYYFDATTYRAKKNTIVDGYKLDANGASKTRYLVRRAVFSVTNDTMTNNQKIKALFNYVTLSSWTYKRTYEHVNPKWTWYSGWTDDFAYDLLSTGQGNCYRYAAVLGYMIKEATGYEVWICCGKTYAARGGFTPHGWTIVKIGGTWYAFDPDMYKFYGHKSKYYYQPYETTRKTYHRSAVYTTLNLNK